LPGGRHDGLGGLGGSRRSLRVNLVWLRAGGLKRSKAAPDGASRLMGRELWLLAGWALL